MDLVHGFPNALELAEPGEAYLRLLIDPVNS
jgi:hypothetical protein